MESADHDRLPWTGRGFMAMGLSMLIPGLGQAAAGRVFRGLVWFIISLCTTSVLIAAAIWPALVPTALVVLVLGILISIADWIDAFRVGARSTHPMLGQRQTRFLVGFMAAFFGLLGILNVPIVLIVHRYLCEAFVVPSASMEPTLLVADHFLVHKLAPINRWSIIAFHAPSSPKEIYVKRVVGLPGETVAIVDGIVHINNQLITSPPTIQPIVSPAMLPINATLAHPITLGADEYFVIGDNSAHSYDSRFWRKGTLGYQPGAVPGNSIVGTATYIYWPPHRWMAVR